MKLITILFAAALSLIPLNGESEPGVKTVEKPKIVAHRGYWNCEEAGFAKNSLAAFRCALEEGFWGTEFDVNITKDGRLVVYHDLKADRMHFNKHDFKDFKDIRLVNGESIPVVEEFLELALKYPDTRLIYELKPQGSKEFDRKLIDATKAILEEYGLMDPSRVSFISFSFDICRSLAEELPGFEVQFLGFKNPGKVHRGGINGVSTNQWLFKIFPKRVKTAKGLGMTVNCWTVNKEKDMRKMIGLDVDMITTDHPQTLRKMLKEVK